MAPVAEQGSQIHLFGLAPASTIETQVTADAPAMSDMAGQGHGGSQLQGHLFGQLEAGRRKKTDASRPQILDHRPTYAAVKQQARYQQTGRDTAAL
ncbi:hypothetical protein LCR_16730 [Aeromonas enteropelogenes]|uniref:Uncharacterized protein n=1 Tax=Aeromonas enteropelogenes TaxID=29489 RepID=A0A175VGT7_AEREN|nr:hypothetical protein LCR_16730 [Aeromonas enteropelogenes]